MNKDEKIFDRRGLQVFKTFDALGRTKEFIFIVDGNHREYTWLYKSDAITLLNKLNEELKVYNAVSS